MRNLSIADQLAGRPVKADAASKDDFEHSTPATLATFATREMGRASRIGGDV